MSQKLRYALQQVKKAKDELREVLKQQYPVGSVIEWVKIDQLGRQKIHTGQVTMHGYEGTRIKVKNWKSGCEYWIDAGRIY